MAERVGFEPTVPLPARRISSAVLSTTQPPLRETKRHRREGRSVAGSARPLAALAKVAKPDVQRRARRATARHERQSSSAPAAGSAARWPTRSRRAATTVIRLSRRSDPPIDLDDDASIAAAAAALAGARPVRPDPDRHRPAARRRRRAREKLAPDRRRGARPAVPHQRHRPGAGHAPLPAPAGARPAAACSPRCRRGSGRSATIGLAAGSAIARPRRRSTRSSARWRSSLPAPHPQAILVGLHPGTVDTALSAPFQRNVADGRLFTPGAGGGASARRPRRASTPADSGGCFDWRGRADRALDALALRRAAGALLHDRA